MDGFCGNERCHLAHAGFHLTRRQLNVMPDPEEAYARRGAPFTFNAGAFYQAVLQLRKYGEPSVGAIYNSVHGTRKHRMCRLTFAPSALTSSSWQAACSRCALRHQHHDS